MPTQDDDAARAAWHAMLRANDDAAHRAESARSVADAVAVLETRLAEANASRHALVEAVALRERLLAEQTARMGDLDADQDRLREENTAYRARLAEIELRPLRTLPGRTGARIARSLRSRTSR